MMRRLVFAFFLGLLATSASASSYFDKGLVAYGDGLYKEAARLWSKGADKGDAASRFNLAVLLEHGTGIETDLYKATAMYRQAARQGFIDAQFSLANILMQGSGPIEANTDEALMWYLQAADAGHVQSQFVLGSLFYNGKFTEPDIPSATSWLKLASDNGHVEAISLMARINTERREGVNDEQWVLDQNPEAFTVELFKAPDLSRALKFVEIVGLETAAVFETRDGLHRVIAGVFDSEEAATEAITALPDALRRWLPTVRPFENLQGSVSRVSG